MSLKVQIDHVVALQLADWREAVDSGWAALLRQRQLGAPGGRWARKQREERQGRGELATAECSVPLSVIRPRRSRSKPSTTCGSRSRNVWRCAASSTAAHKLAGAGLRAGGAARQLFSRCVLRAPRYDLGLRMRAFRSAFVTLPCANVPEQLGPGRATRCHTRLPNPTVAATPTSDSVSPTAAVSPAGCTMDHTILGVHVLGANATELIHIGQTVMGLNGTSRLPRRHRFQLPDVGRVVRVVAALDAQETGSWPLTASSGRRGRRPPLPGPCARGRAGIEPTRGESPCASAHHFLPRTRARAPEIKKGVEGIPTP